MRRRLALCAVLLSALCGAALLLLLRRPWSPTGSRYVSWLPSFSVEVTRVPGDAALAGAQLEAAAAQLQLVFPQHSRAALAADLARTRSADLTLDNILEGRLPRPAPPPPPPPPAPAARFSPRAAEREAQLRRRKEQLLAGARRRYLQRAAERPPPS